MDQSLTFDELVEANPDRYILHLKKDFNDSMVMNVENVYNWFFLKHHCRGLLINVLKDEDDMTVFWKAIDTAIIQGESNSKHLAELFVQLYNKKQSLVDKIVQQCKI